VISYVIIVCDCDTQHNTGITFVYIFQLRFWFGENNGSYNDNFGRVGGNGGRHNHSIVAVS